MLALRGNNVGSSKGAVSDNPIIITRTHLRGAYSRKLHEIHLPAVLDMKW
jgi:hypothetical protein